MTQANKVVVQIDAEDHPAGCGVRCPACRCSAKLENGQCVACSARAAAKESGRSAADALLLAIGKRTEHQIDQGRHHGGNA